MGWAFSLVGKSSLVLLGDTRLGILPDEVGWGREVDLCPDVPPAVDWSRALGMESRVCAAMCRNLRVFWHLLGGLRHLL